MLLYLVLLRGAKGNVDIYINIGASVSPSAPVSEAK